MVAIALVSLFIICFDNTSFWAAALRDTETDDHRSAILVSLFLVQFCSLNVVLALAFGTRTLKTLGIVLLITAAGVGFFMSEYGVLIDPSMIRSVIDTDVREASPLLTSAFFVHILVFGVLPALALTRVPLGRPGWKREAGGRLALAVLSLAATVGVVHASYESVSFFAQQHRQIRLFLNPGYPIYAWFQFLAESGDRPEPGRIAIAYDAVRDTAVGKTGKHALMIFVLGETARADRFSLNGYGRDTNHYTRGEGVIDFPRVTSCGTSTADSVPCLFSRFGREKFDHAAFAREESLLGTFARLGIDVLWRDNNTGCKDVCSPERYESLATEDDEAFCDATGCFDEILLRGLEERVADSSKDHFIVLHQRGSHGPAYYTDVPQWAKEYLPECDLPNLRNCSGALINNAYDNTIVYTDYFLSKVIEFLRRRQEDYDVAMFYVSDHGESLGEGGIYLHGFPYAIAPVEQTHVPMMFWATDEFMARSDADPACIGKVAARPYTHDSVFHTLLGLFDVSTSEYRASLDIFAPCRPGPISASVDADDITP